MEQWISKRLSECLGFPVPDEMIAFVLTLKEPHEIEEYFETLLDASITEHRVFLNDFIQRVCNKDKASTNKSHSVKRNPLGLRNQNKKADKYDKSKSTADSVTAEASKLDSHPGTVAATKKKPKYVNLYGQDGTMNDVVLLKGRHMCNCQASKHSLVNNCMQCGRIVCEQEGSGPCLYCGNLVCTEEENRVIESSSKKGDNLKKSLLQQQRPKGWEEALAMRNRLLEYDRTSEKRTTVIDDESDYFKANSVWLSDEERAKLKKLEQETKEKRHASRLSQKVTIDFTGRQVVEEAALNYEYDDEVLQGIIESYSKPTHTSTKIVYEEENSDAVHPLLDAPPPIFDDSVATNSTAALRGKLSTGNDKRYDGVYNRVQDKELLEVADMKSCLSMHQPWASLLVAGIKKHEGRPWYTSHRGRLWIASTAKPVDMDTVKIMEKFYKKHYNDNSIEFPKQYPSGCLLGCLLLQDCLPQEEYRRVYPTGESESPYVFICTSPQELPIRFPIKGLHKIYKVDENIHVAAVKALQRAAKLKADEKNE